MMKRSFISVFFFLLITHSAAGFNKNTEKTCEDFLNKYKFLELRNLLYSNNNLTYVACQEWLESKGNVGHVFALYLLIRDSYHRYAYGGMELSGENLITTLTRIMKFLIRFEQDAACWNELAQPISENLTLKIKTKIRDWFFHVIRESREQEYKKALTSVKKWIKQFPESAEFDVHFDEQELAVESLPLPTCVRAMKWIDPNTLTFNVVENEWISTWERQAHKEQLTAVRKESIKKIFQEFDSMHHAQEFIHSLSNEPTGMVATASSYLTAGAQYLPSAVNVVTRFFW